MRKRSNAVKTETSESYWKRRPSEIRGYNRTLYTTTEDDDYIRIDYNLKDKKVRLYIEDNEEGGNPYYSVITNGKITVERNATTGRITPLAEKFTKRADIFSSIPNRDVIKLINRNYGIGIKAEERVVKKEVDDKRKNRKKVELEHVRRKYFQSEPDPDSSDSYYGSRSRPVRKSVVKRIFHPIDFVDVSIGVILCIGIYIFSRSFVTLGVFSAFIGIFIGLLDVYYRERRSLLIKMILFLLAGMIFYIYGYYIL